MSSVKILKIDPTGFFVKNETTQEDTMSGGSNESSVASLSDSESEKATQDLDYLPQVSSAVSVIKEDSIQDGGREKINANEVQGYLQKPAENINIEYTKKELNSDEIKKTDPPGILSSEATTPTSSEGEPEKEGFYSSDEEEVINMTDTKLYDVLATVLEDQEGNNVSENLNKITVNLEKHNEVMGKLLSEYTEMNKDRLREKRAIEDLANAVNQQTRVLDRIADILESHFKTGVPVNKKKEVEPESDLEEEEINENLRRKLAIEDSLKGKKYGGDKSSRKLPNPLFDSKTTDVKVSKL